MKNKWPSLLTFIFFLTIALITMFYGQRLALTHTNIRVWDWISWLMLLAGLPFILLQKEAGLPEVWEQSVSNKNRIIYPLLIGLLFGALDVLIVFFVINAGAYDSLPPFLQPFPYSIFLYTSGAFDVEIFYRLIPITLLLIIGKRLKWDERRMNVLFITTAIITSLREPIEQLPDGPLWFIVYAIVTGFAMNYLQAVYFKKAGFLASIFLRLGHYLLWHILLGIYVENSLR